MSKNLDVDKFRNGQTILNAQTDAEWISAGENKQPAWCYYDNDLSNGAKYGKLYNWYAVTDPRGLCPAGWHVPSDAEWTQLTEYLGGEKKAGKKMKAKEGWFKKGNGNNSSGFTGLPGGYRLSLGEFDFIFWTGFWWSSTEDNTDDAWDRLQSHLVGTIYSGSGSKRRGVSVRCVANDIIYDIEPD